MKWNWGMLVAVGGCLGFWAVLAGLVWLGAR